MLNTVRAGLAGFALLVAVPGTASADDYAAPASSPHYELVAPATHNRPASYAYYPDGNNPRHGTYEYHEPAAKDGVVAARSKKSRLNPHCASLLVPCSKRAREIGGLIDSIFKPGFARHY